METRNIQKTGGSSFTLTIPKDWVLEKKLDKNGQVEILTQKTGQLSIRPKLDGRRPRAKLFIDRMTPQEITREIISYYIAGFDEIDISGELINAEDRRLVRNTCQMLYGFELFESTSKNIKLRNVSSLNVPVNEYIRRMFLTTSSMLQDLIEILLEENLVKTHDIIDRDSEVDIMNLIIDRYLSKQLCDLFPSNSEEISLPEIYYFKSLSMRLERIADHVVHMASAALLIKNREQFKFKKPERDRLTRIEKNLMQCEEMVVKQNKREIHALLNEFDSLKKNEFLDQKINDKSPIDVLIENSTERIRRYLGNIVEETLNFVNVKQYILERNSTP